MAIWNLRPAHFDTPATKIELIHAKSSDFAAYGPRAVDFDPETFSYRLDPTFDHEMWQYELERARNRPNGMTATKMEEAEKKREAEIQRKVLEHVISNGSLYKSELEAWMRSQGMAKNIAQNAYSDMVKANQLAKVTERLTNRAVVGIPSVISKMLLEAPPGKYRLD